MSRELEALDAVDLGAAPTADEVWTPVSYHVNGLHPEVYRRLTKSMDAIGRERAPLAAVVCGERGTGKTHLVGWTREEIQSRGGFFFYMKLVTGRDFWESATGSLVDGLYRKDADGQEQLLRLLDELARRAGVDSGVRATITGGPGLAPAHVDAFIQGIRNLDRQVGNETADTARALVLAASSGSVVDIGTSYLALNDDDRRQRAAWGLPSRARPAQLVLRDLTRLFALVGPLVLAFDQLDNLIAASETSVSSPSSRESRTSKRMSSDIAAGLMELREEARRTLIVVACQPDSWEKISRSALRSALDRFDVMPALGAIPDQATAAAIVGSRLHSGYQSVGFVPPYQTWPISMAALNEAAHRWSARRLVDRVNEHLSQCLATGTVTELATLSGGKVPAPAPAETQAAEADALTDLFGKLRGDADYLGPLDNTSEDRLVPALIGAGLRSLIKELGLPETRFVVETEFGGRAALHARLRFVRDAAREDEIHWCFRAIATSSPRAAQTRLHNAMVEAGLQAGLSSRRLVLLRNTRYPGAARTEELKKEVTERGGLLMPIGADDLRTFGALRVLLEQDSPALDAWLKQELPASHTELFSVVLDDLHQYLGATPAGEPRGNTHPSPPEITVGTRLRGDRPFAVALNQLAKHTLAIGASGSGKTVLIKHLVEQCALRGVSAIVLDPNGDLARLGDPWPDTPPTWTDDQEDQARQYFAEVEVVVWTPGLNRGRPLSFHPLPDFAPVLGDEDDFARLLTSTVAALAPAAGVHGTAARAIQQTGILQRALDRYARDGGRTLAGLIELLEEPSADLVNSRTRRLAVHMADTLEATLETDPLLGESGAPADPGLLLTPSPGKSARISVISFTGLSGDGPARFVSRLQGALFSWFKGHPVGNGLLGGLLVMDEAQNYLPSGSSTPSTGSSIELIRQIRKYGLGMVLGAQNPKGIHHHAVNSTANQFIGRLTADADVSAARSMAQSRNASLDDLGVLTTGIFYAAGEGTGFTKIQVPYCLSHHDAPLQEDEILERAHRTTTAD